MSEFKVQRDSKMTAAIREAAKILDRAGYKIAFVSLLEAPPAGSDEVQIACAWGPVIMNNAGTEDAANIRNIVLQAVQEPLEAMSQASAPVH